MMGERENERFGKVFGFRFYVAAVASGRIGKVCATRSAVGESSGAKSFAVIFVKIEAFVEKKSAFRDFAAASVNLVGGAVDITDNPRFVEASLSFQTKTIFCKNAKNNGRALDFLPRKRNDSKDETRFDGSFG